MPHPKCVPLLAALILLISISAAWAQRTAYAVAADGPALELPLRYRYADRLNELARRLMGSQLHGRLKTFLRGKTRKRVAQPPARIESVEEAERGEERPTRPERG